MRFSEQQFGKDVVFLKTDKSLFLNYSCEIQKGNLRANNSNIKQPKLHISIAFEYELSTNVSGALYNKVPNMLLRTFSVVLLLNCLACPKSPITKSEPFKNILLNILIIIYNSNK